MALLKFILLISLLTRLCAGDLQSFPDVVLIPTDWADGDSFRVRFPSGEEHTLRLYGADCFEWHLTDDTDARRLRAQRRYFGISDYQQSPASSIKLAKAIGEAAALQTQAWLARPFTVHTSFADGRGSPRFKRIYAFVSTAEGEDLATLLVAHGLARAYGVMRSSPDGQDLHDYREQLEDAELVAARQSRGAWAYTDWASLPRERRAQRIEEQEERIALGTQAPAAAVDLNQASRDELMRIPGIGEVTALAIIEARPFLSVDELTRVSGIGPKSLDKFRPWLKINP